MPLPSFVRIAEMGPRDGLQNEKIVIPLATKIALVDRLIDAGVKHIEVGSFVSPKWVPQMADSAEVFSGARRIEGVSLAALTPNLRGYEGAKSVNANEVGVFAAASEAFSKKNTNCSIDESLERIQLVIDQAHADDIPVRGYVSCVMGCPYEGDVDVDLVVRIAKRLLDMGCYEISLGDTIGTGTAAQTRRLIQAMAQVMPIEKVAVHFHDTYGQALTNIFVALQEGVSVVDSSVAGLGGCPYAKGASGNVATEDVLYLLAGLNIETGIDLHALVDTGAWISGELNKANQSKAGAALFTKKSENKDACL